MSEQDRVDRLERRVASLEQLMRRMMAGEMPAPLPEPEALAPVSAPVAAPTMPAPAPARRPLVLAEERPASERAAPPRGLDGEQWVGQRGLLAVGVIALVLAAGYLLKLSFDRGWISPALRCISGAVTGLAVAALGWVIDRRGYRTYGPALMGAGAAILYTVIWAASTWYAFIPPLTALVGMAAVSMLLAAAAWVVDRQWLGSIAAVGVFLAPLVIDHVDPNADRLLAYLASMGLVLGAVAWKKEWRFTMLIVALSYFGVGAFAADLAWDPLVLAFGAVGGSAGMAVGLRKGWWETRFFAFWGGWAIIGIGASTGLDPYVLMAATVLALPVWQHAMRSGGTWPSDVPLGPGNFLASTYFYFTPFGLTWAVHRLDLAAIQQYEGLAAAVVTAAYLAAAVGRDRRPFALVTMLGAIYATWTQWNGHPPTGAVLGLVAVGFGVLARQTKMPDWDLHAFLTLMVALSLHWLLGESERTSADPAFTDRWALVLWGLTAVAAALVVEFRSGEKNPVLPDLTPALWSLVGIVCFMGVSWELDRFFTLRANSGAGSSLAGSLAVSAWWLIFSGAAVWLGFRRGLKPVRVAGLLVSGLALVKVLLFDLSRLDALYRIGSVFLLGLVSLLVAWAYHRRARAEERGEG